MAVQIGWIDTRSAAVLVRADRCSHATFTYWPRDGERLPMCDGPEMGGNCSAVFLAEMHARVGVARVTRTPLLAERLHTKVLELDGLAPDTVYAYALQCVVGTHSTTGAPLFGGSLRTASLAGPTDLDFLFGSCIGRFPPPLHRLKAFECMSGHTEFTCDMRTRADFLLLLGDLTYTDFSEYVPWWRVPFKRAYEQVLSAPELKSLMATVPSYGMWDDHEVANDYTYFFGQNRSALSAHQRRLWGMGALHYELFWGQKAPRRHAPPLVSGRTEPLLHQTFSFDTGALHAPLLSIFVPETRTKRSGRSMLGEEQWARLERWLRQSEGVRWRVIASPSGWSDAALDAHFFPADRERLVRLLAASHECGVVILSGDIHWGGAWQFQVRDGDRARWNSTGLWEFGSSPFSALMETRLPVHYDDAGRTLRTHQHFISRLAFHAGQVQLTRDRMHVSLYRYHPLPRAAPVRLAYEKTLRFEDTCM